MSITARVIKAAERKRLAKAIDRALDSMTRVATPTGPGYALTFANTWDRDLALTALRGDNRLFMWLSFTDGRAMNVRFKSAASSRAAAPRLHPDRRLTWKLDELGLADPRNKVPATAIESRLTAIEKRLAWLEHSCPIAGP